MKTKYLFSVLILYMNYFIHGIGASLLSQQVVKEMLVVQWGLGVDEKTIMQVTAIAAALGLGRLISLPFAGPLSDKLGRRISVLIGVASYTIFFVGIAFRQTLQWLMWLLCSEALRTHFWIQPRIRQLPKLFMRTQASQLWELSSLYLFPSC